MVEPNEHWIVSDRVLAPDGREQAWALSIKDGVIAEIVPAERVRRAPAAVRCVDYGQRPIVPAFCNGHSHLAMAPLRGLADAVARSGNLVTDVFFAVERHLEARDVYAFTKLAAYESMLCGVAAVWDHYYFGEAVADALEDVGMCGVVAPTLQDRGGPGSLRWEEALETTHALARKQSRRVQVAVGLHASDTASDELFESARATSRHWNIPIHMHLAQSADEMHAAEGRFPAGLVGELVQRLAQCRVLMAHGCFLNRSQVRAAVEADWVLAHCPLSQVQFGIVGPLGEWRRAGGRWVVGTDCVASNDALEVQRELPWVAGEPALAASYGARREALLERGQLEEVDAVERERRQRVTQNAGLEPIVLLRAAWGPQWSGTDPQTPSVAGPIEVGRLANLLVLDPDHPSLFPGYDLPRTLAYGATSAAIHQLIIAGREMGRAGGFQNSLLASPQYRDALAEARRRAASLFDRAGLDGAALVE